jgi:ribosome-associated translation inhibitor RaiA
MDIEIRRDAHAMGRAERRSLGARVRHSLQRFLDTLARLCIRVSEACASAAADDRFCEIEAHLSSGIWVTAEARGRNAAVAIDRALRKLARALAAHFKREAQLLRHRATLALTAS